MIAEILIAAKVSDAALWRSLYFNGGFWLASASIAIAGFIGAVGFVINDSLRSTWRVVWAVLVLLGAFGGVVTEAFNRHDAAVERLRTNDNQYTLHADNMFLKRRITNLTDMTNQTYLTAARLNGQSSDILTKIGTNLAVTRSVGAETKNVETGTEAVETETRSAAHQAASLQREAESSVLGIQRLLTRAHVTLSNYNFILNPRQPFATRFSITNDSDLELRQVAITCKLLSAHFAGFGLGQDWTIISAQRFNIEPGQSADIHPCGIAASNDIVQDAVISIGVSYSTSASKGFRFSQSFHFSTVRASNGELFWVQNAGTP